MITVPQVIFCVIILFSLVWLFSVLVTSLAGIFTSILCC